MNLAKKHIAILGLIMIAFFTTSCGSVGKETLLNTIDSENGFVINQKTQWGVLRTELVDSLPNNKNLLPENKSFDETRNFKANNGTATVWPSETVQFKNIDAKLDVLYEFNADDQLYCGRYRAKFNNSDSKSLNVMKQVLNEIFAKFPTSSLGGKEFIDTVQANQKIEIYWEGENETLLRIQAMSVQEAYFIDIQVGLKAQMLNPAT